MQDKYPAIETRDLSKRYGRTTALEALDLRVERGSVFGFLGPNGAGKTTTIRLLTGLIEPSRGEASVAGTPVGHRRELVEHVGYLPEEPPLYDQLTGREQLQFAADIRGLPWSEVGERALSVCDALDLTPDLDRRIDGYSTGMCRKAAFAQAVFHDPDVVFLDEPTSGLDPRAAKTLRDLIVELADGDTTVFLSTHILPVVEEIANRVGILQEGRLVAEEDTDVLIAGFDDAAGGTDLEDVFLEVTSDRAAAWGG